MMRFSGILCTTSILSLLALIFAQEIPPELRVDCHPDPDSNENACLSRGCYWNDIGNGYPSSFLPENYGYLMIGDPLELPDGYLISVRRSLQNTTYFGDDFEFLTVRVYESDNRVRIKIEPTDIPRFEVPLVVNPTRLPSPRLYRMEFKNSPVFSLSVIRESSNQSIFDTSLGGLTFSEQFIQLGIKLPSTAVYGIGENEQHSFRQDFSTFSGLPLWARGDPPDGNSNLYGVQPYYTNVEDVLGNTHSVMIVNSNAQEFVRTPAPGFIYRTIGGLLDIYIFLGPTPEKTAQQFTEAVGRQPIPPYWGLGFQLSRWGYNTIQQMKLAVDRTAQFQIPHDVQYGDIDIMERALDFTYDKVNFTGLPEYIQELKGKGIKFVTILDPGISFNEPTGSYRAFDLGEEMDVWVKNPDGTPVIGSVWPGDVYFADYSKNSTREWWITLITEFKSLLDFDGLWIDMNEPDSWLVQDCENNAINFPPYVPGITSGILADATICPDAQQTIGIHYDVHNLYGWSEAEPTLAGVRQALVNKRGLVLSRSTFLGAGKWAAHWLGDNFSNWTNLHYSIIGMLQFNQFGIPYVGADICGFFEDASPELCQRWHQLGAFYTFSRNHNGRGYQDQDPGWFGFAVAESTRKALTVRYTLLPYLYTLFYEHRLFGSTVVRAIWHEFPYDQVALDVDRQFLWGPGLLVSPVLEEGARSVQAYFSYARWYDYYTGTEVPFRGEFATLPAPLDFINLHFRGGIVYPTQEPAINTELSRLNPYGLIVTLDDEGHAIGRLFIDDGDSVEPQDTGAYFENLYFVEGNRLETYAEQRGYDVSTKILNTIRLLGVSSGGIREILVNSDPFSNFTNLPSGEVLITDLNFPMDQTPFVVEWFK